MARVYSSVFFREQGLDGLNSFEVPADEIWVLRDVSFYIHGDLVQQAYSIYEYESNATLIWTISPEAGDPGYYHWEGRKVIEPGISVIVDCGGTADVDVCGYNLASP